MPWRVYRRRQGGWTTPADRSEREERRMETNIDRLELLPAEPPGPDPALACPNSSAE
jgi:hypothetical protein